MRYFGSSFALLFATLSILTSQCQAQLNILTYEVIQNPEGYYFFQSYLAVG